MAVALTQVELHLIEKLREQELQEARVIQLQAGDSLLFFTDGLTDARSIDNEEFDEVRLHKVCLEYSTNSPLELLGHIFGAIQKFCTDVRHFDDMTATLFQYSPGIEKKIALQIQEARS
jgi:hypothetical protein